MHMASVEDATRGERAAGRPCEPSLLGLFVLVTVMGEPAEFIRSAFPEILREIALKRFVLKQTADFFLKLRRQRALASKLVDERRVQIHALRDSVFDELIEAPLVFQEESPVEIVALLKPGELGR